jgi:calcium-binding protein CML
MGAVASICTEPMKRRRAERDLDGRVAAALRERARARRQRAFRSVNSITMRLPRFKEGLRDIRDVFDHYGKVKPTHSIDCCPLLSVQMR